MSITFQSEIFNHTLDLYFAFKWRMHKTGEIIRKSGILEFERYNTRFGMERERRQYLMLTLTHPFGEPTPIPMKRIEFLWKLPVENVERLYKQDCGNMSKEEFAHSILTAYPLEWGHVSGKADNLYFTPSVRKKLSDKLESALADWLWFESGLY